MECASTFAQIAIEKLLRVYALANMGRASNEAHHFETALGWLPDIEDAMKSLRSELEILSEERPCVSKKLPAMGAVPT